MATKNGPAEKERSNIIQFPVRSIPRPPASGGLSKVINREVCLALLGQVAPLDEKLTRLLEMPEKMYMVERSRCFSSQPDKDISGVVMDLLMGVGMPHDFAAYGIDISDKGSNLFCTFVDRGRKVIVSMPIQNIYSGDASWSEFREGLEQALALARKKESLGEKFDFIINSDSVFRTI